MRGALPPRPILLCGLVVGTDMICSCTLSIYNFVRLCMVRMEMRLFVASHEKRRRN